MDYEEIIEEIEIYRQSSSLSTIIAGKDYFCDIAIDALRDKQPSDKLDRSRWEGCRYCENTLKNYRYINACDIEKHSLIYDRLKYCPMCGRPLTEEAWAELERRLE